MKTFKLTIEYDGSRYHGWQRQKNEQTIQGTLEAALKKMTGQAVPLTGSGRTDAGVHAWGQVASFRCSTRLTGEIFQRGLNSLLPNDIVITACSRAHENFHARYDAKSKCYRYQLCCGRIPPAVGRQYVWHIKKPLNLDAMREATAHLQGTHDFRSFEGAGSPRAHTIRHVIRAEWILSEKNHLQFEIEADGFLRFMVRNIVGTAVDVGLGKYTPREFLEILESKDRTQAGATAPAQGLFLVAVKY